MAELTAWVSAHALLVAIVGGAAAILAWRNRDKIKAAFAALKGGGPASGGTVVVTDDSAAPVMKASFLDKLNISDFLTELSKHPLIQKLDVSREALVRTLFSFWIIKMADWVRKTTSLNAQQKQSALNALTVLSPLIQIGGAGEDTPTPDPAPQPVQRPKEPVI